MNKNIKKIIVSLLFIITLISIYFYVKNSIDINKKYNIIQNNWWVMKWKDIDYEIIWKIKKENIEESLEVEVVSLDKRNNLNKLR